MEVAERSGHIAVCVDKYLLVWGGYRDVMVGEDQYLNPGEIWVYDAEIKTWHMIMLYNPAELAEEPMGTSGATADVLNKELYIFGGHTLLGNTNDLLKIDLTSFKITFLTDRQNQVSPRDKLTSWVYQNSLYYFGGYGPPLYGYLHEHGNFVKDDSSYPLFPRGWNNQLLVYDTVSGVWTNPKCKGHVPSPRAAHAVARVGDLLYLFGGRHSSQRLSDLYQFHLPTLTWTKLECLSGPQPEGRSWHSLTAISPTSLFLFGGYTQHNCPLGDAWVLDLDTLQWTRLQLTDQSPRLWHTASLTGDQDILIFGGCSNDILGMETVKHCNDIIEFRLSPRSLTRLCLDSCFNHREICEESWQFLPKHLQEKLISRLNTLKDKDCVSRRRNGDNSNLGQTCAVS